MSDNSDISSSATVGASGATHHVTERFETKYLIETSKLAALSVYVTEHLEPDPLGDDKGRYQVWSLYYDTKDLKFYWEKLDGLKFRRKLRVRSYAHPSENGVPLTVFAEVKQRLNRVSEKRRIGLSYDEARDLCDRRIIPSHLAGDETVDEIATLGTELALQPTTIVGYQRQAFVEPANQRTPMNVRVTFDTNILGRGDDLDLGSHTGQAIVPPHIAIVEIKTNRKAPEWLANAVATHGLQRVRISKYCQSIEACGLSPKTVFTHNFTSERPTDC